MDNQELNSYMAKKARENVGMMEKKADSWFDRLGSLGGFAATVPLGVGGILGYLLEDLTAPNETDYQTLKQKAMTEMYHTLAEEAEARAELQSRKNKEEK